MDITTKIAIGILMVLIGGMMFLVAGNVNCDEAKNIQNCKGISSIMFWFGQALSLWGIASLVLTLKFTKPENDKTTQENDTL